MPGWSRVGWVRGRGCLPLAEILADAPIQIDGDLTRSCVANRIDALVARRMSSFDLVPTLVPHGVDLDAIDAVSAAVADGPHSPLVAALAARLGARLGVRVDLVTAYRGPEELPVAMERLQRLAAPHPGLEWHAAQSGNAAGIVDTLIPNSLLLVGAPGGSWFQRQLFGPGHRLLVSAPAGAVVVRDAPRRCYHVATDPAGVAVGSHLTSADARRLIEHPVVPVTDRGLLVGVLRASALTDVPSRLPVGELMEAPVAVAATEDMQAVTDLLEFFEGGPVPVVDHAGYLIGTIGSVPDGREEVAGTE
jgi:hypothetical protein